MAQIMYRVLDSEGKQRDIRLFNEEKNAETLKLIEESNVKGSSYSVQAVYILTKEDIFDMFRDVILRVEADVATFDDVLNSQIKGPSNAHN